MIFPCPAFAIFLAPGLLVLDAEGNLAFLGTGSSSEKDSQTASSFVTIWALILHETRAPDNTYQDNRLHLSPSSSS